MTSNEKKINKLFFYWLSATLFLVFLIIIVGGLTRLTNSGLSITEWELFTGIVPPLNEASWLEYFNKYKQIPQFTILNSDMSLEEFKIIFYWEFFHRFLAKLIGVFFFIPLIVFFFTKSIKKEYLKISFVIMTLIILQGLIGWFMVTSGLITNTSVSHYRLSIHLTTAILIVSIIFWLMLNIISNKNKFFFKFSSKNLPFQFFILLIFVQIVMGAFVSGLDAGKIYQTWPLMGNTYFPNDLKFENINIIFDFDNHSLVQFYHRNLAYLIILYFLFLLIYIIKNRILSLYKPLSILAFFVFLQVIFGIFTLISGLNIFLASAHQVTSVLLVLSAVYLYYLKVK